MFDEGYKSTEGCLFCNERCAYQYLKIVFELGWKRSKAIYVQAAIWERDMDSISASVAMESSRGILTLVCLKYGDEYEQEKSVCVKSVDE